MSAKCQKLPCLASEIVNSTERTDDLAVLYIGKRFQHARAHITLLNFA
jgi:hypothetical protein